MGEGIKALLILLGVIPLMFATALIRAWAFCKIWAWFLVPVGLPDVTYLTAIGVSLLVGLVAPGSKKKGEGPGLGEAVAVGVVTPLLIVGMGWMFHAVLS